MSLSDHLRAKDWTFSATSRVGQRRSEFALYLLIASLGMFFAAAALSYVAILFGRDEPPPQVDLPPVLWLSTAFAFAGSGFLWASLRSVRRERQDEFRGRLVIACLLGGCFCLSQTVGPTALLGGHFEATRIKAAEDAAMKAERAAAAVRGDDHPDLSTDFPVRTRPIAIRAVRPEGLLFVLVLLHALHFVAGMTALTVVTARGLAGRYDHEYHGGVKLCALYWRFLDVVWVVLFGTFLFTS